MTKELPLYNCHKQVRALEIKSVGPHYERGGGSVFRPVTFRDEGFEPISIPENVFARYVPVPGDFYVVYESGYESFSPRQAFLDGYALASDGNVLMERLNDMATAKPGSTSPDWLWGPDWSKQLARVAREAYVTINSLKQQLETKEREQKTSPDRS